MHRSPETEHRYLAKRAVREWEEKNALNVEHAPRESRLRVAAETALLCVGGAVALLAAFAAMH